MITKSTKKILGGIFALSCAVILAGCDNVEALPNNYNDKIVENADQNLDLYKNEMGIIYDAIASGKTDRTIDQFLLIVAQNEFGTYYGDNGLKAAVDADKAGDDSKMKQFIGTYGKAYTYSTDDVLGEEGKATAIYNRVKAFADHIQDEINKVFYDEIKSGSYTNSYSVYSELKLAEAKLAELYNIALPDGAQWYKAYITKDFKKETVSNYVHLDRYTDFIERKIIPTVYKDKMVEEYIMKNNYSALGRAYGRKVNVLKVSHNEKNIDFIDRLVQKFADMYILDNDGKAGKFSDFVKVMDNVLRGFDTITYDADNKVTHVKGFGANSKEVELLNAVGSDASKVYPTVADGSVTFEGTYNKESKIGELMEDYILAEKAEGNRFAADEETTALNKFTGSGKHPKEEGLVKELVAISTDTAITDGWFVKNGGLSDLPSSIRDRLFNINVSNQVGSFKAEEMETKDKHNYDAKKYVRYINNTYYLTPSKSQQAVVNPRNFVIHDSGTNSFYIVNIENATSTSKLRLDSTDVAVYGETESQAREISRVLGTKDSYTNNAYASYMKDNHYDIVYHDQTVYDYFKSTYPELFE